MGHSIRLLGDWRVLVGIAGLVTLTACGGGSGGESRSGSYFPLNIGDHWTYRTQAGELQKVRVTDTIASRLGSAMVVRLGPPGATALSEQSYIDTGSAVIAVPTDNADPLTRAVGPTTLLRYPLNQGDSFLQTNLAVDSGVDADGDGRTDALSLRSEVTVLGFEPVATEAGAFAESAHVRTLLTMTLTASSNGAQLSVTTTVDDWYVLDVGPVRSEAVTRSGGVILDMVTLDLVAYQVGGRRSESVAPTVSAIDPSPGSVGPMPLDGISVAFSESIDADTASTSTLVLLDGSGEVVPIGLMFSGNRIILRPDSPLASGMYRLRIEPSMADLAGNSVAAQSWVFTIDATAPSVVATSPAANATQVPLNAAIRIEFSEDIDPASIASGGITLRSAAGVDVPTTASVNGNVVGLTPSAPLQRQTEYTVTVNWFVRDLHGNPFNMTRTWAFVTDPGLLSNPIDRFVGSYPGDGAVAVGDVNGDGRADVVTTTTYYFDSANDFKLFVFLQQADGSLAEPIKLDTVSDNGCRALSAIIADMNGDGRNDVVIGESGCGVEIFYQDASGHLAAGAYIATPESHKLRAVDLDGDGRADLVGIGWGTNQAAVWRQGAGGTLTGPTLVPIEHYGWGDLDVGDINGDGRPDIVVTSGQGDRSKALGWVLQQGDGGFGAPQYRAVDPSWGSWGVAIGDVNGDGRNDVVTSFYGNSPTYLGVFYQQGDGGLGPLHAELSSDTPGGIEIADMNADGRKDVVVLHRGGTVSVHLQRPDGTLAARELFKALHDSFNPQSIAVGDFTGDGHPDVALAGLAMLINRTPIPANATTASGRKAELPLWQRWRPGLLRGSLDPSASR